MKIGTEKPISQCHSCDTETHEGITSVAWLPLIGT